MNIKAVVKVMNFHSLLRVDASRRRADIFDSMKDELESMMRIVMNNRNLRLDKRIRFPDPSLPVLRIYLGSDFGFCGSVNTSVSSVLAKDSDKEKVVVGKKLRKSRNVSLYLTQEEFNENFQQVRAYLERAVRERPWSAVELVYNHYFNLSSIRQVTKRIYPLDLPTEDQKNMQGDFVFECDPDKMLMDMTVSYMVYELRIAAASAYASENIMRQNATSESLKKLDEAEAEALRLARKERSLRAVQKTTDSYIKQKALERM